MAITEETARISRLQFAGRNGAGGIEPRDGHSSQPTHLICLGSDSLLPRSVSGVNVGRSEDVHQIWWRAHDVNTPVPDTFRLND